MRLSLVCGLTAVGLLGSILGAAAPSPSSIDSQVDALLPQLTLDEKIALVHGDTQFTIPGVPRLGIPRFWFSDGPHGVREEISIKSWDPAGRTDDFATYLPVGSALAATWNPELAHRFGQTIAAEARARKKDMMLGPGVNMLRTPLNGRTFEYYGEDPYLAGQMAAADIRGLQDGGVAACVKHYALNNQEQDRFKINVEVDERTLREIYLPAFETAVKEGGVLGVMGAYNQLNGQYCCHNEFLLNQVLKREWDFRGVVLSDWAGVHETREAALNGLDIEMGTDKPFDEFYLARPLKAEIEAGRIPLAALDEKVRRVLRVVLTVRAQDGKKPAEINAPSHQAVALRVAEEALVLLKNEGATLPLDAKKLKFIAVIGENAVRRHGYAGHSSEIKAFYEITPLDGIVARVGDAVNVTFAHGYRSPARQRTKEFGIGGVAKTTLVPDAAQVSADRLIEQAVAAAKQADVVLVFGGSSHDEHFDAEGADRKDLQLPHGQDALIAQVVAANPRTIVVLFGGSAVEMGPWLPRVPALVHAWYPGMEGGTALARVLFGEVNPSGKLPFTFPKKLADTAVHHAGDPEQYPGVANTVHYKEGLLIGYRWHDAKAIEPQFPFGHGLSYTRFALSNLTLSAPPDAAGATVSVTCEVANVGDRAGAEVVQVYVEPQHPSVFRPVRELKGFVKVSLAPGETKRVAITLKPRAFAYYSVERKSWLVEAGAYVIRVGTSSRALPLSADWKIARDQRVE